MPPASYALPKGPTFLFFLPPPLHTFLLPNLGVMKS